MVIGGQTVRVIIMTDVYLPFLSGVSTVTYTISRELPKFGVDTVLVAPDPYFHFGRIYTESAGRTIVLHPSLPLLGVYSELRFPTRYYDAEDLIIDGDTVFHIHSPMIFGTAVVKNLRNKRDKGDHDFGIVGVFHTRMSDFMLKRMPPKFAGTLTRLLDFYTKHIFRRMDVTTTLSSFMKDFLKRKIGIENVIVMPNPLNRAYYAKPKKSIDAYYDDIEPSSYFLYLGRISPEKNVDLLTKIFCTKRKNAPKLLLAGTGPILEKLKVAYRNTNCTFLGRVDFKVQKSLYRDAIALVSASDFETQGMVFLEAMAQGTPVIAYHKGGQIDYLKHEYNSLIFKDPAEIPTLAKKLMKNEELREILGTNAKKTAHKFHPESLMPKYKKLFEKTLEHATRR